MIRESSVAAFRDLRHSGAINELQTELLDYIFRVQDVLVGVCRHDAEFNFGDKTQTYGPRFAELERRGLLVISGTKSSPRTGRKVQAWRVPAEFDEDRAKKKTKKPTRVQELQNRITELEAVLRKVVDSCESIHNGYTIVPAAVYEMKSDAARVLAAKAGKGGAS